MQHKNKEDASRTTRTYMYATLIKKYNSYKLVIHVCTYVPNLSVYKFSWKQDRAKEEKRTGEVRAKRRPGAQWQLSVCCGTLAVMVVSGETAFRGKLFPRFTYALPTCANLSTN